MQQLEVNISIPVPEDMILIKRVEFIQLKKNELAGVYWNMKDLEERTKRKSEWIKENILYPPKLRKILDAEKGGFVFYPKTKGQTWVFQASKMASFLDKHFHQIFY